MISKSIMNYQFVCSPFKQNYLYYRDWLEKNYTGPKSYYEKKNLQFHSHLAEVLAILPTYRLIILTNLDDDQTKILDFLS